MATATTSQANATAQDCKSALAELKAAGTAQNRKIYARHGATDPMFGVSYAVLDKLAKKIKINHDLAGALWASGNHDARVLGLKIADPALLTSKQAKAWVKDVDNYILAGALGGLIAQSSLARSLSDLWRDNRSEWLASTGWFIVTCTAEQPDIWSEAELSKLIKQVTSEIHSRPNRVRHEMNGALIVIALRSSKLCDAVLKAAKKIGTVDVDHGETNCKTPDIELYVTKTLAHRSRKSKSA